ncbi:transposase [Myxococcus stipitatus]|uniref:transposase n=1 Tax=Myxococcus stipitatus TaxID=83455 RepID=UPI002DD43002|nr:transposase [Myxococcus stipitatus]
MSRWYARRTPAVGRLHSYDTIRRWCRRHGVQPIVPTRSDQPRQRSFRHGAYRKRCRVEHLINRLKQNRRVATRYEKRATNYLAMVHIAAIRLWLQLADML